MLNSYKNSYYLMDINIFIKIINCTIIPNELNFIYSSESIVIFKPIIFQIFYYILIFFIY